MNSQFMIIKMPFVQLSNPLSQNVYNDLTTLSLFTTSALFCKFPCVIIPLLTFSFSNTLLFASARAITRVYFDPINYYFD